MDQVPQSSEAESKSAGLPTFRSLPYRERWRLIADVRKGIAPSDPRLAVAAAEWARSYLRARTHLIDAFTAVGLVVFPLATVWFALNGKTLLAISTGLVTLIHLAQVALTPVFRRAKVERLLEACDRIADAAQ